MKLARQVAIRALNVLLRRVPFHAEYLVVVFFHVSHCIHRAQTASSGRATDLLMAPSRHRSGGTDWYNQVRTGSRDAQDCAGLSCRRVTGCVTHRSWDGTTDDGQDGLSSDRESERAPASGLSDAAPCRSHVVWLVGVIWPLSGSLVTACVAPSRAPPNARANSKSGSWMPKPNSRSRSTCSFVTRGAGRSRRRGSRSGRTISAFLGSVVLELRPGQYTFEMERGPEYKLRSGNFVINPGATDNTEVSHGAICGHEEGRLVVRRPAHSPAAGGHSPADARRRICTWRR